MIIQVYYSNFDLGPNNPLPSLELPFAMFRICLAQFRIRLVKIQIPDHLSLLIKGF